MGYIVKMPKLGIKMNQGMVLEWFGSPGETVTEGTPIAEVESEKNIAEIEASEEGTLRRIYVSEGEAVGPGTPLGIIAGSGESLTELESEVDLDPVASAEDTDTAKGPTDTVGVSDTGSNENEAGGRTGGTDRVRASPKAKKRARDLDLDIASVDGSGPQGAVTAADIEAAIEDTSEPTGSEEARKMDAVAREATEERELSGMRQTIADRLGHSYREAVHVTVSREIDVEEALTATDVVDEYLDRDVSITDVLLVALSATLDEHPEFNATFEDGVHRIHERQNVGVAVDVDGGLLTPVLSAVDERSLSALVRERSEMTERALSGEHVPEDLSGGTFTVTNLGMFGVDSFTPIINPPEVAILGVCSIRERPVRTDDGIGFRRVGGFDLAFDHRVVDGADAARFLDTFETHLTEPWPLLLDRA